MECTTPGHCRISHLITLPPHFTLAHSTSNTISDVIPSHATLHVTPSVLGHRIAHFISHQHLSQHTYSTLQYHIGFKSHHICHIMHRTISSRTAPHFHIPVVAHNATLHVFHTIFQITRYIDHISHRTTFYTILRRISHAPHLASLHHI